jgi:hypothetical protein
MNNTATAERFVATIIKATLARKLWWDTVPDGMSGYPAFATFAAGTRVEFCPVEGVFWVANGSKRIAITPHKRDEEIMRQVLECPLVGTKGAA